MLINILKDKIHVMKKKKLKIGNTLPTVCLPMIEIELCNYIGVDCT